MQKVSVRMTYSKTCVKRSLSKIPKIGYQDQLTLNAGQKSCRMLQGEHSAILSTFNKLPLSLRYVFYLFLSGRFTQVLMYRQAHELMVLVLIAYELTLCILMNLSVWFDTISLG